MDWRNRIYCGDLRTAHVGQDVLLMGWVDAIRDHGHILFVHLRDIRGIVQVVFDLQIDATSHELSLLLKQEFVVEVAGKVVPRAPDTHNPNLRTGDIEVIATRLTILSKSIHLPFNISEKAMVFGEDIPSSPSNVDEDLRLQFRYLDLRRPSLQDLFIKRYQITKCIRDYFDSKNFIEMETPYLTRSTPEGARDYLVPSRVHRGRFYALPQSPQLFKQIFMISGMDRYFQIVRCFRDEDLRPNRQPEFTQIDLEASFIDEEFIFEIIEGLTVKIFALGGIQLSAPFPRMTYTEAMDRYGTDRPDVRFGLTFVDVTDLLQQTSYGVFKRIIGAQGRVKGFCIHGQAQVLSKNVLQNEYSMKIAPSFGAKGMTWMKVVNGALESNIVQFFSAAERATLIKRFQAQDGDVIILVAEASVALLNKILCSLRLHMADRLGLIPQDQFRPLWVTEFPLFELNEGRLSSSHHPFTMPVDVEFDPKDLKALVNLKSRAYDLVMNGEELGGGSVRIHRMDIQKKIFQALGLSLREIEEKFGFFLRALEYGAPPHAGLALGLDRLIAMILQVPSIREVIAFPKNRSAFCPLTEAPSLVDLSQLLELGLNEELPTTERTATSAEPDSRAAVPASAAEKITLAQVQHVAKLARLALGENEAKQYQRDLNAILDYVAMLDELDTEKVPPLHHVLKIANAWRADDSQPAQMTPAILANAPVAENDYFKVPKILES